ncbi:hypothetical protein ACUN7V_02380 [Quadrisphaera oryzae]|uniref:hypothetical protein n=1 Tax=Quadrisphaera TaxID=317661 RepID=UPI00164944E1|nr:hypothetical protein [Quadrisphaera sp. RL12-1S]MBC3761085.1 hypothetical protein [Quadrisphaera sp. RL12-1S]
MTAVPAGVFNVSQYADALLIFRPLRVARLKVGDDTTPRQVVHADVHVLGEDGATVLPAQVVAHITFVQALRNLSTGYLLTRPVKLRHYWQAGETSADDLRRANAYLDTLSAP